MNSKPHNEKQSTKQRLSGRVVSRSGDKTVAVEIAHSLRHGLYKKTMKRTKKYLVHDERNEVKVGDVVTIQESRPLSRRKRWTIIYSV